ncbi:ubiquinol-cytochrome C chaperone [Stakelama sp. CBK3Z-3]|uniref:Ubiquinol-cytochrome C chaperone n=1 Tax=Stakelama flava TaxID=2860338 RepID=A0ABS6XKA6_9SPHN|nr:ubiquinol-cytochrome C chaperone family protein [Stakelama flava]MBW4330641.1 ubiquinol-cytochrome C chaperone [Stakelama flava]
MGLIDRLFSTGKDKAGAALYDAVVARGRRPHWYIDGAVADTVDGRFDMIAAILSMVLLTLEERAGASQLNVAVTERFIDDMDGQLRQIGIGDIVVGKHVGRMMGMLGGRLGAYRAGLAAGDLAPALVRNLYRGEAPAPEALSHVAEALCRLHDALGATDLASLEKGELPE